MDTDPYRDICFHRNINGHSDADRHPPDIDRNFHIKSDRKSHRVVHPDPSTSPTVIIPLTSTPTVTITPSLFAVLAPGTQPFGGRTLHASCVFDNKMWVIAGEQAGLSCHDPGDRNDVWSSVDGSNWNAATTAASFCVRTSHACVVFNNKMWVIAGINSYNGVYLNDVWSSSDGVSWSLATSNAAFCPRYHHQVVVFDAGRGPEMWVIGGYSGSVNLPDVWHSLDGVTWTQATTSAAFGPRQGHTVLAFQNKMWVICGAGGALTSDVWSSSDGVDWTKVTTAAAFPARSFHTSLVYNGEMWVIAGMGNGTPFSDAWHSPDGVQWTEATNSAGFPPRAWHTSVVLNDEMWVIDGQGAGIPFADVWHMP